MKIKITYRTDDELSDVLGCLTSGYEHIKLRRSDRHPPYRHAYITVGMSRREQDDKKILNELRGNSEGTPKEARGKLEKSVQNR